MVWRARLDVMEKLIEQGRIYFGNPSRTVMPNAVNAATKMILNIDVEDAESAAEQVLADPDASAAIEQVSSQFTTAGAGKLPPNLLLLVIIIWLLTFGFMASPLVPDVPAALQQEIALAPAYVGVALSMQRRITDNYRNRKR